MAIVGYVKPAFQQESFTCPHCNCFSQHEWRYIGRGSGGFEASTNWVTSWCLRCKDYCLWEGQTLVWPLKSGIPDPIDGCPEQIQTVYNEARQVFPYSPRSCSSLSR